ncbi:MAG: signal peptide peptidase SppA, partial [Methyloceanibacter sp.]
MVLDAATVIDRRRLRRRLTLWRIAAVVLGLTAIGVLAFDNQPEAGPAGFLPHIARLSVSGIITDNRQMQELIDK